MFYQNSFNANSSEDDDINLLEEEYASGGILNIKDHNENIDTSNKNSHLIKVKLSTGKYCTVKKRTLCWLFQNQTTKLSSDRILRFKNNKVSDGKLVEKHTESYVDTEKICVEIEKYYAVFYEEDWFLGRIIENQNGVKIKFLKKDLDQYIWPKNEDMQVVQEKFIFYGPINLLGNSPFFLKRPDKIAILKKYKNLKKTF